MNQPPLNLPERDLWVFIAARESAWNESRDQTRSFLKRVAELTERHQSVWMVVIPSALVQYQPPVDAEAIMRDIEDQCDRLGDASIVMGWSDETILEAQAFARRILRENFHRRSPTPIGLLVSAAAIIREVWALDPEAELLISEGLDFTKHGRSFETYPRVVLCPEADPGWRERVAPNIRYGIGGMP
jgi:hypothetical protein